MKIHGKWVLYLVLAGLAGLGSCSDDDDVSQDDAQRALESEGNMRVLEYGFFGTVKTATQNTYRATWENNVIRKGTLTGESIVDFNEAGGTLSEKRYINLPKACKWSKDNYGNDVIVVTDREMKIQNNETMTFDSRNRPLTTIEEETSNTVTFGGYQFTDWEMLNDTIWTTNTGSTTFTSTSRTSWGWQSQITYDDANRKATAIVSEYDTYSSSYVEDEKYVYDYNQFDRLDENSYESFPVLKNRSAKAFDSNFNEKSVIQYDSQGNPLMYYYLIPDNTGYYVNSYSELSYVYY